MIKRKKHSCRYEVHKAIIHKLSRNQVFKLCVLALFVLAVVAVCAPSALLGLM